MPYYYCLESEPKGESYQQLIHYLCEQSDAVMLVICNRWHEGNGANGKVKQTRKMLRPYRIKTRHNPVWPTTISEDTETIFNIDMYQMCPEMEAYLLSVNSLYEWSLPDNAEDIAFFKDGICLFASCSHERFAWIHCDRRVLLSMNIAYSKGNEEYDPFADEKYKLKKM